VQPDLLRVRAGARLVEDVVVILLNVALKLLEILLLLLVELSGSSLSFTKDNES
jgi:hypothetical protein